MKRKTKRQKQRERENALESIFILWQEALKIAIKNPERARLYVKQIRAIKKHVKVTLPQEIGRSYCKNCLLPFIYGKTAIKRIVKGIIVITCLSCGKKRRFRVK